MPSRRAETKSRAVDDLNAEQDLPDRDSRPPSVLLVQDAEPDEAARRVHAIRREWAGWDFPAVSAHLVFSVYRFGLLVRGKPEADGPGWIDVDVEEAFRELTFGRLVGIIIGKLHGDLIQP